MGKNFLLLCMPHNLDWIPDTVNFTLWGAIYFLIPRTILEPYSGAQLNYLKMVQFSSLLLRFVRQKQGFPWWLSGKDSGCSAGAAGDTSLFPGLGRSPGGGHGNPVQYSCLENLMDRGAWWATVHRVAKSWTWLKRLNAHTHRQNQREWSPGLISPHHQGKHFWNLRSQLHWLRLFCSGLVWSLENG